MIANVPHEVMVLGAQRRWAQALVERQIGVLDSLVSPTLRYTHSTGVVHDRAGYLEFVRSGPMFVSVALEATELRCFGEVTLLVGTLRLALKRADAVEPRRIASIALQVWRFQQGNWVLELAQATPSAAEAAVAR